MDMIYPDTNVSTIENLTFCQTSGFYAQTLMAILKVELQDTFFPVVCG